MYHSVIISIRALSPFTCHLPNLFSIWITLTSVCSHFPVALSFIVLLNTSALWVKPPKSFFYYRYIVKSRLLKERSFTWWWQRSSNSPTMLNVDFIVAKPEIPLTSTKSFATPAIDNTAFTQLPNSSLLTGNLTDTSVFTVPSHTPSQPLPDLFTTPYARDEAANISPSLIVNSSPDNKVKNSIFSRFWLNKAVDKLSKTPNKGRNTHHSKQPQSPPFLARLASHLSSANTSTNTSQPIGLPKVTSSPRLFAGRKKIPESTATPKTLSRQLFNCNVRQGQPFHSPAPSTFVAPTTRITRKIDR